MRIISCASYYGTGSSAITDLITEYEDVKSLTNYEFRFLQDPGGVCDLEFQLLENHHRHTSGHALKTFRKFVDMLGNPYTKKYEHYFKGKWKEISYAYIEALTDFTFTGYWHQDVIDRGRFFHFRNRLCNKILKNTIWRSNPDRSLNELPRELTYCSAPTREKFLNCTKEYIDALFAQTNDENKNNIMVDQIVPPSNLNKYIQYFSDIKVFLVERDPRDIYLSEKYLWKGRVVPTQSVEVFCKWYEYTRGHRKTETTNPDKVMFIQFEDLIYNYESTVRKVEEWLGMTEAAHQNKKTSFIPEQSKNNTQIWKKLSGVEKEMEYIEKHLSEYLYAYHEVGEQ